MSSGKQPDNAGLQSVSADDGPEAVPTPDSQTSPWRFVEHSQNHTPPQSHTPPAQVDKSRAYYYGGALDETYYGPSSGLMGSGQPDGSTTDEKQQARICGLRKGTFYWLLAAVILIIIIAAVLGGVLGTVLDSGSKPSSSLSSPSDNTTASVDSYPSIYRQSGVAVHQPDGSSTLYSYYQDPEGRIIENQLENGKWSIQGTQDPPDYAIVSTGAQLGSPISAISWNTGDDLYVRSHSLQSRDQSANSCSDKHFGWTEMAYS